MDIASLHVLLVNAAETDRKMPIAMRKQKLASWPDYPSDWHGYGWTQKGETILKPTSQEISNYDKAMSIVARADETDRQIIWAVAVSAAYRRRGAQWSKLSRILGLNDPRVVKQRYKDALMNLYYGL